MSKTRIAINGFGRIGRLAARVALGRDDLELVAINDLAAPDALAYLFAHDSVQGRFGGDVRYEDGALHVDGAKIRMTQHRDPAACAWGDIGVDVLLECTGVFLTRERAQAHFDAGAPFVLLSAPAKDKDIKTVCLGVNEDTLDLATDRLISNASCTTNCVAPVLKALDDAFGVRHGTLLTVHAYTISQSLLDAPQKNNRSSRAAALNLVPASTGAAKAVGLVMPQLAGKLDGMAVRTPNPTGSLSDLTLLLERDASVDEAHDALRAYAEAHPTISWFSSDDLVSTDVVGLPFSSIVDSKMTMKVGPMLKVLAWYDNEMGYATRIADLAAYVGARA